MAQPSQRSNLAASRMPRLPPFNPLSLHWPALPRIACWSASVLLDTYVGNNAGPRFLGGQIRRGDTSTIHAAIWLSDMRGFTRLADRLPPQTLVDMLNRYFDCQVPAIAEQGGEVLKFIGDVHGRSLDWRRRVIQQNSQRLVLPAEVGFGSISPFERCSPHVGSSSNFGSRGDLQNLPLRPRNGHDGVRNTWRRAVSDEALCGDRGIYSAES